MTCILFYGDDKLMKLIQGNAEAILSDTEGETDHEMIEEAGEVLETISKLHDFERFQTNFKD